MLQITRPSGLYVHTNLCAKTEGSERASVCFSLTMVVALSLPPPSPKNHYHLLRHKSRPRPKSRLTLPRAALVEARPRPAGDGGGRNEYGIQPVGPAPLAVSSRDRTEDLQAEARAMARAANALSYSPELLSQKYGSRPIKVPLSFQFPPI